MSEFYFTSHENFRKNHEQMFTFFWTFLDRVNIFTGYRYIFLCQEYFLKIVKTNVYTFMYIFQKCENYF